MSKLLNLKEVVEMNSDEFHESFLKEQEESTTIKDLIGLYLQGKIAKEVFAGQARTAGAGAVMAAAAAMGQGVLLLVSGALGYGLGTYLRKYVYPDYNNEALERIKKATSKCNESL